MADIPTRVRQVAPSGRVAGAVIPFDIADTGQGIEAQGLGDLGRAISGTGRVIAELVLRDRKANDLKQASVDATDRQNSRLAVEEWKNENPLNQHTAENFATVWDQNNQFDPSKYLDEEARDKAQIVNDAERDSFIRISAITATDTRIRDTILSTKDAYILEPNQLNRNNYQDALSLMHTEDRVDSLIAIVDAEILENEKESAIENIKPLLVQAIESEDKQAGLAVLNKNLDALVESGVLTKAEGAQTDKVLGDWIDNFVAGREKRTKEKVKLTTIQTYNELSNSIIGGLLTFDDIDQSSLLRADKELWQKYIKGSYKDAPTENTPAGHDAAFNAVFDVATLQLSPKEAMDVLLEARFIDDSITNAQFEWGKNKIENPYPRIVMEDLNTITQSNLEDFNRFFKADKKRNRDVNQLLIAWVDSQIKEDKVPTRREMHAMSSQFRVGDDRWQDVGQIIDVGGREWEVVGFDDDGSALVEEVQ